MRVIYALATDTPWGTEAQLPLFCLRNSRYFAGRPYRRLTARKRTPLGLAYWWCNVNYLESTLTEVPASVDSKALTEILNPLDATLMKNQGVGAVIVN